MVSRGIYRLYVLKYGHEMKLDKRGHRTKVGDNGIVNARNQKMSSGKQ